MDWMSALRYGLILQQERLRRAREPRRGLGVSTVYKWVRAALEPHLKIARRATGSGRDKIEPAGGPALPRDGAPA